jgi:PadR family transcriptional regulator, regulatory protein AphA
MSTDLTPTARVILGMLSLGAGTGYEIKRAIDLSTRFFWSASYGQIYPELHRLEQRGLVEGRPDPRGGVKRTSYRLTQAGEAALHAWLTDRESYTFELRDEGLLRLFFGDLLTPAEVVENLRARQAFCELVLAQFRELEPEARTGFVEDTQLYPYLALSYGIELMSFMRDWCERTGAQIEAGELPPAPNRVSDSLGMGRTSG